MDGAIPPTSSALLLAPLAAQPGDVSLTLTLTVSAAAVAMLFDFALRSWSALRGMRTGNGGAQREADTREIVRLRTEVTILKEELARLRDRVNGLRKE